MTNTSINLMKQARTILFDLDGTLIDSAPDLVDSLNVVLTSYKLPPVSLAFGRPHVGTGALHLLKFGLQQAGQSPDDYPLTTMREAFLQDYAGRNTQKTQPFPGINALLHMLHNMGKTLIVATNKPQSFSEDLIDHFGWRCLFDQIVAPERVSQKKPDGAHLLEALSFAGKSSANAIMVGDTKTDYDAAIHAKLPIILVDFGYDNGFIKSNPPHASILSIDDLLTIEFQDK